MTLHGILQIISCLYLAFVVTFVLGLNEFDDWSKVFSSTLRRWAKFIFFLLIISIAVQILGS